jgi:hypothetical protein
VFLNKKAVQARKAFFGSVKNIVSWQCPSLQLADCLLGGKDRIFSLAVFFAKIPVI